jgi:hypothetical protein
MNLEDVKISVVMLFVLLIATLAIACVALVNTYQINSKTLATSFSGTILTSSTTQATNFLNGTTKGSFVLAPNTLQNNSVLRFTAGLTTTGNPMNGQLLQLALNFNQAQTAQLFSTVGQTKSSILFTCYLIVNGTTISNVCTATSDEGSFSNSGSNSFNKTVENSLLFNVNWVQQDPANTAVSLNFATLEVLN